MLIGLSKQTKGQFTSRQRCSPAATDRLTVRNLHSAFRVFYMLFRFGQWRYATAILKNYILIHFSDRFMSIISKYNTVQLHVLYTKKAKHTLLYCIAILQLHQLIDWSSCHFTVLVKKKTPDASKKIMHCEMSSSIMIYSYGDHFNGGHHHKKKKKKKHPLNFFSIAVFLLFSSALVPSRVTGKPWVIFLYRNAV